MKILYSDEHRRHSPREEFDGEIQVLARHPEMPARAEMILATLRRRACGSVVTPRAARTEELLAVHAPDLLRFLEELCGSRPVFAGRKELAADVFALHGWGAATQPRGLLHRLGLYCFDAQTPLQPGTWRAAVTAAGCALSGADLLLSGEPAAYALCRPPGHHAGQRFFGGYCYLNNAALAARRLGGEAGDADGDAARVAILDLDYHHGNGTQEIFYRDPAVLYVSLHADPNEAYPYFTGYPEETGAGPGEGANLNLPLALRCDEARYRDSLAEALEAVARFGPVYLVISLGTDILSQDPVGGMGMSVAGFGRIGEAVRGLDLPTLIVQEGGYAVEPIGDCVAEFLGAWA